MLARVPAFILDGIDASPCEVEVHLDRRGLDKHTIVGLPDTAVKESLERVRAALTNAGYEFPNGNLLINLAPADVRKEGPLYDLPIAVGLLIASGAIPPLHSRRKPPPQDNSNNNTNHSEDQQHTGLDHRRHLFAGELALDGRIRPVRGIVALATLAKQKNAEGIIIPAANADEAAIVHGINVYPAGTISEVVGLLTGALPPEPTQPIDVEQLIHATNAPVDFAEVKGQEAVKRALLIAAAGQHNILMLGPPGSGKTMMARALPGILPPMTPAQAIEATRIYSAAGKPPPSITSADDNNGHSNNHPRGLVTQRPVRSPHHTASTPAIVGGGAVPRPGEISLAHHGVLFLDELPEFPRPVLETLRQPLEDRTITIARSHSAVTFPASFMLVAAMNPTPKGDIATDEVSKRAMDRYLSRLSGPLIDRIDIHVEAPAVPWKQLAASNRPTATANNSHQSNNPGSSTAVMREKVLAARRMQTQRQGETPNASLTGKQLDTHAPLQQQALDLLGQAMNELGLSARAYDKIRRVARTIADIEQQQAITTEHVAEAIQYRLLDRKT